MAIMPQLMQNYHCGVQAEEIPAVPEFDIYLRELEHQQWQGQFAETHFHHPSQQIKQEQVGLVPVPKIEHGPPEYDYLDTPWPHWQTGQQQPAHLQHHPQHHHQLHVSNLPMSYSQTGSPTNPPLQLSDPPTPAAECQVTSTNLSPIPHSPYSPNSDVGSSYDGMDGLGEGLGLDSGIIPFETEFSDVNIKGLTEEQLVSLTARDLNRICREMPEDVVKQLKKRRRTLKNRGYAYNSRVRRVTQKTALETERDDLRLQIQQLSDRCKHLEREADQWKRKAQTLERGKV